MQIKIKLIPAEKTYLLRHEILRPNQTLADCKYPGDYVEDSFHLGAFTSDELVGIASFFPESMNSQMAKAFRLRGMAVKEQIQGKGIGTRLLEKGRLEATSRGGEFMWANARTSALDFYENLGFSKQGEEFILEPIGPHFIVLLPLERLEGSD